MTVCISHYNSLYGYCNSDEANIASGKESTKGSKRWGVLLVMRSIASDDQSSAESTAV
jgi:hypothetical protein